MKPLKVLDLFSGIGGFSLGLERTGGFEIASTRDVKTERGGGYCYQRPSFTEA